MALTDEGFASRRELQNKIGEESLDAAAQKLVAMGVEALQVQQIMKQNPELVRRRADTLGPIVMWLAGMGMCVDQVSKVVKEDPGLFHNDVRKTLIPRAGKLSAIGMNGSQLVKAIAKCPQILRLDHEDILRWLLDLGMKESQVAETIVSFPQLLTLSLEENLKRKANTLLENGLSATELVSVITTKPNLLTYSLDRLVYRVQVLRDKGVLTVATLCFSMKLTDERFASRFV
mmetsp:Transcript_145761/g.465697  ORF Transcript_145761/g.465697 Transcript_145761/m.465697 type:complete len:232 (-) Transcript_145761:4-699(-)